MDELNPIPHLPELLSVSPHKKKKSTKLPNPTLVTSIQIKI